MSEDWAPRVRGAAARSAEEVAGALVTVEPHYVAHEWRVVFGEYCQVYSGMSAAATQAATLRRALADAIREHDQELARWALADGPERPVSEEREETIRERRRKYPNLGYGGHEEKATADDLLALLGHARSERDHLAARLALLITDSGQYAAGLEEGWKQARAACVEAAAAKAEDLWNGSKPAGLAVLMAVEAVPGAPEVARG